MGFKGSSMRILLMPWFRFNESVRTRTKDLTKILCGRAVPRFYLQRSVRRPFRKLGSKFPCGSKFVGVADTDRLVRQASAASVIGYGTAPYVLYSTCGMGYGYRWCVETRCEMVIKKQRSNAVSLLSPNSVDTYLSMFFRAKYCKLFLLATICHK